MPLINPRLASVLEAYRFHPEFLGTEIEGVEQKGALDSTPLHIAARSGNLSHIQILADAGADINAAGDLGSTPLHEAALCGQAQAVSLLLALGADSTLKNEFGQTALDIALVGGNDRGGGSPQMWSRALRHVSRSSTRTRRVMVNTFVRGA